ncbi:diacylglycerol O-acyltransferase 1-like [Impatiens glandulifera]|uniref:diacylglycerol O-acyltransferase 1-like n=1 Tax=Impatiens glandulifera TaxID=253017 RepID=UPI001FB183DD|nr:diacylglycerol O-acyltransferase 1-like [Impatiens glandulifera]
MQYGCLMQFGFWFSSRSLRDLPLFVCGLTMPIFFVAAFFVEKLAQKNYLSEKVVVTLHVFITTASVLYPALLILRCDSSVFSGFVLMLFVSIVWLKLVSYAHTNYDLRAVSKASAKGEISYGSNVYYSYDVNIKSLTYFMCAPTLCYQTSYPRTASIRKGWVVLQLIKLVIFIGLMAFIIEQYINPIFKNSKHPLKVDVLDALERVLKLSIPYLYLWFGMFYCFFHLWLNIVAEVLRFGDREFYKEWWNAKSVKEYWRLWNMPVHKWMVRHVYFPCLRSGTSKIVATSMSFLVSAVFHELCVGVPCHVFKFWAFFAIMFQVPMFTFTDYLQAKFQNSTVGNMIFWFFISIFGQPMCLMLFYHDLIMNRRVELDTM